MKSKRYIRSKHSYFKTRTRRKSRRTRRKSRRTRKMRGGANPAGTLPTFTSDGSESYTFAPPGWRPQATSTPVIDVSSAIGFAKYDILEILDDIERLYQAEIERIDAKITGEKIRKIIKKIAKEILPTGSVASSAAGSDAGSDAGGAAGGRRAALDENTEVVNFKKKLRIKLIYQIQTELDGATTKTSDIKTYNSELQKIIRQLKKIITGAEGLFYKKLKTASDKKKAKIIDKLNKEYKPKRFSFSTVPRDVLEYVLETIQDGGNMTTLECIMYAMSPDRFMDDLCRSLPKFMNRVKKNVQDGIIMKFTPYDWVHIYDKEVRIPALIRVENVDEIGKPTEFKRYIKSGDTGVLLDNIGQPIPEDFLGFRQTSRIKVKYVSDKTLEFDTNLGTLSYRKYSYNRKVTPVVEDIKTGIDGILSNQCRIREIDVKKEYHSIIIKQLIQMHRGWYEKRKKTYDRTTEEQEMAAVAAAHAAAAPVAVAPVVGTVPVPIPTEQEQTQQREQFHQREEFLQRQEFLQLQKQIKDMQDKEVARTKREIDIRSPPPQSPDDDEAFVALNDDYDDDAFDDDVDGLSQVRQNLLQQEQKQAEIDTMVEMERMQRHTRAGGAIGNREMTDAQNVRWMSSRPIYGDQLTGFEQLLADEELDE